MNSKTIANTLTAVLLSVGAASALAAPYAITYGGGITARSTHPDIADGEPFTVTFIVDNGGTTAADQRWLLSDLRCTIWRIGSGSQRTTFTHPLTDPINQLAYGSGAAASNAQGTALVSMIEAGAYSVPASDYTQDSPLLNAPVTWNVDGFSRPMLDTAGSFDDAADGVPTDPQYWSAPVAVAGACDDTPVQAPPPPPPAGVQAVPALGMPALALLGLGAAGLGALRLRRKHS